MRLSDALIAMLVDEGVDRVFGNPGTTELPFVDALVRDGRLPYVLAPHEGPLVAMADGYARSSGRTAFVNLHVAAGTANGLIGLLNASRSRTPMVVLAGQQDSRHLISEPMLSGDLIGLASAATTWAVEARRADEVPLLLRRAFRAAVSAPQGPVFVSVPMDMLEEEIDHVPPRSGLTPGTADFDLGPAADLMLSAERPVVVAGDGVGRAEALEELMRISAAVGADVYHAPMNDRLDFPMSHPAYQGMLAPENAQIKAVLDGYDVALLAGVRAFAPHHYSPGPAVGPNTRLLQVDDDDATVGRTYPVEVGLAGDVRSILGSLADGLEKLGGGPRPVARRRELAEVPPGGAAPLHPRTAAATVAANLPPGTVLVEESITVGLLLREHLQLDEPGSFQHTVGGGLGWGIGAAVGTALARPDRCVVAALGDGCALFGLQGLWTAARERVPVTFVVFANGEYRTLKQTLTKLRDDRLDDFVGMDLGAPAVDWPALSGALGVPGVRVTDDQHLAQLLRRRGPQDGPLLVEVPTRGFGGDDRVTAGG